MNPFANKLGLMLFGVAPTDAIAKGVCVKCKKPAPMDKMDADDKAEYNQSGLCPHCFAEIWSDE